MARPSKAKTVIPVVPLIVAGAAAAARAVAAGARHGSKIKRGGKTTTSNMMAKDAVKRGQLPKSFSPTNSPKMKPVPVKTKLTKPSVRTLGRASKTAKANARKGAEGPKRRTPVKKGSKLTSAEYAAKAKAADPYLHPIAARGKKEVESTRMWAAYDKAKAREMRGAEGPKRLTQGKKK